jgi:dTDP-4-amino-4,6-dideoxygalactose transaminase
LWEQARLVNHDTSTAAAAEPGPETGDRPLIPVMKPWLGAEEADAAAEAVRSGWVAQGPRVAEFEVAFAAHLGAGHAVATSSCTTALHLTMVLAGLGSGDEVVVPSLSFIATANAPRYVQATPVFADVDQSTQNLTAETVEAVLTPATRAVIVVHQGGAPADVDAIRRLCREREIDVIEDAACALGSTYAGRPVGVGAELATYSFHPRKLVTTGEGGMLLCDSPEGSDRARRLREHGMSVSAAERHRSGVPVLEQYLETGFNFRMTDVQAAIGLVQLGRLPAMVARRRQLARRYSEAFADLPGVVTAADPPHGTSNFQSYWLLLPPDSPIGRNELLEALGSAGISARRGIMAAHREPAFAGHPHIPLPVTERLTGDSVILPLYHTMSLEDQDRVIDVVLRQFGG